MKASIEFQLVYEINSYNLDEQQENGHDISI